MLLKKKHKKLYSQLSRPISTQRAPVSIARRPAVTSHSSLMWPWADYWPKQSLLACAAHDHWGQWLALLKCFNYFLSLARSMEGTLVAVMELVQTLFWTALAVMPGAKYIILSMILTCFADTITFLVWLVHNTIYSYQQLGNHM